MAGVISVCFLLPDVFLMHEMTMLVTDIHHAAAGSTHNLDLVAV